MPALSIVVPTYQRAGLLARALDSILEQDFQDHEVIVIDDGSTDDTAQVMANYTRQDPRFIYAFQANQGPAAARNTAIRRCHSDLVAFLDSDDEWSPNTLATRVRLFRDFPEIDLLFSDAIQTNGQTGIPKPLSHYSASVMKHLAFIPLAGAPSVFRLEGSVRSALFQKHFIFIGTVIVRRQRLTEVRYFDTKRFGTEDTDLLVRLARSCTFAYWDRITAIHHGETSGLSQVNERWLLELEDYYLACLQSPEYSDLVPTAKRKLHQTYRSMMAYYGMHQQPRRVLFAFLRSAKLGVSAKSSLYCFLAFFGPKPLAAIRKTQLWMLTKSGKR